MIASAEQFDQTFCQLQRMYRALAALRAEVLPANPKLFAGWPKDRWKTFGGCKPTSTITQGSPKRVIWWRTRSQIPLHSPVRPAPTPIVIARLHVNGTHLQSVAQRFHPPAGIVSPGQ